MRYWISYNPGQRLAAMVLHRDTPEEAYDLAKRLKAQGGRNILIKDTRTNDSKSMSDFAREHALFTREHEEKEED